jgi:hypothetical protein
LDTVAHEHQFGHFIEVIPNVLNNVNQVAMETGIFSPADESESGGYFAL